jgi:hypothetical protein
MKILTNKEIELIKDIAVAEHMEKLMDDEKQVLEKISSRTECLFAFDFANPDINVFSIERNGWNTSDETTIIGYILSGDIHDDLHKRTLKEWSLFCSREQHNELVKKWVEYKSVKLNTSKKILKG